MDNELDLQLIKCLYLFTFTISTPAGYSLPHSEPILENTQVFSQVYMREGYLHFC